jgi:hypothetical protein
VSVTRTSILPAQLRRPRLDPAVVLDRQRRVFGGVKIGAAFFGWVSAIGTFVLLSVGVLALMVVLSIATDTDPGSATDDAASYTAAVSVLAAILLSVVTFGAFFCGGYVAARMSRFDGLLQGLAVWGWSVAVPVALWLAALVVDLGFRDVALSVLPNLATTVMLAGLCGIAGGGSVVGGLVGEHYHRMVDGVGLSEAAE